MPHACTQAIQQLYTQSNQSKLSNTSFIISKIRKIFTIPKCLQSKHFNQWGQILQNSSLVVLYIVDSTFIKSINQKIFNIKEFKLNKNNQFKFFLTAISKKLNMVQEIFDFHKTKMLQKIGNSVSPYSPNSQINNMSNKILIKLKNIFLYSTQLLQSKKPFLDPQTLKQTQKDSKILNKQDLFIKENIYLKVMQKAEELKKFQKSQNYAKDIKLYHFTKQMIQKIILLLNELKQKIYQLNPSLCQNLSITKRKQNEQFLKVHLDIQDHVQLKCLKCSRFFYHNQLVPQQRSQLTDYQIVPSIKLIKQSPELILEKITSSLNKGRGMLFFDCQQRCFGFQPIGSKMNLKQQEAYKLSFLNLLNYIFPEDAKKHIDITIDFVPLRENPLEIKGTILWPVFKAPNIQRMVQSDIQVMRVKIVAKRLDLLFACLIDKKPYFYQRKQNLTFELKGQSVYKYLKQKFWRQVPIIKTIKGYNQLRVLFSDSQLKSLAVGKRSTTNQQHSYECLQILMR